MKYLLADFLLDVQPGVSRQSLLERLAGQPTRELGIGDQQSWLLTVRAEGKDVWTALLCPESPSLEPWIVAPRGQASPCLVVGFDDMVWWLSPESGEEISEQALDSLLGEIFMTESMLVCVLEAGVAAFDSRGRRAWSYACDLIDDVSISDDVIHLTFFDSEAVTISLATGQPLPAS